MKYNITLNFDLNILDSEEITNYGDFHKILFEKPNHETYKCRVESIDIYKVGYFTPKKLICQEQYPPCLNVQLKTTVPITPRDNTSTDAQGTSSSSFFTIPSNEQRVSRGRRAYDFSFDEYTNVNETTEEALRRLSQHFPPSMPSINTPINYSLEPFSTGIDQSHTPRNFDDTLASTIRTWNLSLDSEGVINANNAGTVIAPNNSTLADDFDAIVNSIPSENISSASSISVLNSIIDNVNAVQGVETENTYAIETARAFDEIESVALGTVDAVSLAAEATAEPLEPNGIRAYVSTTANNLAEITNEEIEEFFTFARGHNNSRASVNTSEESTTVQF